MEQHHSRFPWFGAALIVVGTVLLLKRFFVLSIEFSQIFWGLIVLLGFVGVTRGFSQNLRWKVYWSTVGFLYGLFFFLRSIDTLEVHAHIFFPATFMIFGLAFFMIYIFNLRDWQFLIPGVSLTVCGAAFILTEFGYFDTWEVWDFIRTYWPVLLILFGVGMITRRRTQPPPNQIAS